MELFIYIFAALFSVLNPLGAVPIFVGLTQDYTKVERSRVSLLTALNVFIILIISFFYVCRTNSTKGIADSEITIVNDLRNIFLSVELKKGDSLVKLINNNHTLFFKSSEGNYNLKVFINRRRALSRNFTITKNKPKYIYLEYYDENYSFYNFYREHYLKEMHRITKGKNLKKEQYRQIAKQIKKEISIEDLEKLGYDINVEKLKIIIRSEPYLLN